MTPRSWRLAAAVCCMLALGAGCPHTASSSQTSQPSTLDGGTARGGVLSVVVRDANDKPVAGAEIFLFCAGDPPGSQSCTGVAGPIFTDTYGRASMRGLPRGAYTVQIRARDAQREWKVNMNPGGSAGNTIDFEFEQ